MKRKALSAALPAVPGLLSSAIKALATARIYGRGIKLAARDVTVEKTDGPEAAYVCRGTVQSSEGVEHYKVGICVSVRGGARSIATVTVTDWRPTASAPRVVDVVFGFHLILSLSPTHQTAVCTKARPSSSRGNSEPARVPRRTSRRCASTAWPCCTASCT